MGSVGVYSASKSKNSVASTDVITVTKRQMDVNGEEKKQVTKHKAVTGVMSDWHLVNCKNFTK